MGRGTDILVLFVGEDVQSDHVDLGVAVLAGLGGGHLHDLAGARLDEKTILVWPD